LCTETISFESVSETVAFRCPGRTVPGGPMSFRPAETCSFGIKPKLIVPWRRKLLLKLMVSGTLIPLLILIISEMFLDVLNAEPSEARSSE
jgi:hypothetical protein